MSPQNDLNITRCIASGPEGKKDILANFTFTIKNKRNHYLARAQMETPS